MKWIMSYKIFEANDNSGVTASLILDISKTDVIKLYEQFNFLFVELGLSAMYGTYQDQYSTLTDDRCYGVKIFTYYSVNTVSYNDKGDTETVQANTKTIFGSIFTALYGENLIVNPIKNGGELSTNFDLIFTNNDRFIPKYQRDNTVKPVPLNNEEGIKTVINSVKLYFTHRISDKIYIVKSKSTEEINLFRYIIIKYCEYLLTKSNIPYESSNEIKTHLYKIIYEAIISSSCNKYSFKIFNYMKHNSAEMYDEFKLIGDPDKLTSAEDMGEMGF